MHKNKFNKKRELPGIYSMKQEGHKSILKNDSICKLLQRQEQMS